MFTLLYVHSTICSLYYMFTLLYVHPTHARTHTHNIYKKVQLFCIALYSCSIVHSCCLFPFELVVLIVPFDCWFISLTSAAGFGFHWSVGSRCSSGLLVVRNNLPHSAKHIYHIGDLGGNRGVGKDNIKLPGGKIQ